MGAVSGPIRSCRPGGAAHVFQPVPDRNATLPGDADIVIRALGSAWQTQHPFVLAISEVAGLIVAGEIPEVRLAPYRALNGAILEA
jgi:hypothetical protein